MKDIAILLISHSFNICIIYHMQLVLPFCMLLAVLAVPTQFDLRAQSSFTRWADYSSGAEGVCAGYSWAQELAQAASNAISIGQGERISLSAQQLLECSEPIDEPCRTTSKANIQKAMDHLSRFGLTTNDCYLNRPLERPSPICKRKCDNGYDFDFVFKVKFQKYDNILEIFDLLKQSKKVSMFALLRVGDDFNYYSAFKPQLGSANQEMLEYRVAEIVGWKDGQNKIVLRAGPGPMWGYGGYADFDLQNYSHLVEAYYSVSLENSGIEGNIRKE
jgi:hypothetical protein